MIQPSSRNGTPMMDFISIRSEAIISFRYCQPSQSLTFGSLSSHTSIHRQRRFFCENEVIEQIESECSIVVNGRIVGYSSLRTTESPSATPSAEDHLPSAIEESDHPH
jgi:hypothetical protein